MMGECVKRPLRGSDCKSREAGSGAALPVFSSENPSSSGAGLAAQLPAAPTRTAPASARAPPVPMPCLWVDRAFLVPPSWFITALSVVCSAVPVSSPAWHRVHSAAPFCSLIAVASPEGVHALVRASGTARQTPPGPRPPAPVSPCCVQARAREGQGHRPRP